jgi:ferrous iron transport protein B
VVALVGIPNCGKSTLFNALTGAGRAVGNYPGTSVEVGTGAWQIPGGTTVELTDLPGAYSLAPVSPDEELTRELLTEHAEIGVVVVVCDTAHLSRSLVLLAHVRSLPVRVVVALSMSDVAARRGVSVDPEALSAAAGVAAVRIDPRRRDTSALARAVAEALAGPVPAALQFGEPTVCNCAGAAPETDQQPTCCAAPTACTSCPGKTPDDVVDLARAEAIFDWVNATSEAATTRTGADPRTWTDRVDAVLTAPVLGPLLFLALMWGVFVITTKVAAPLQDAMDLLIVSPLSQATTAILGAVGLGGGFLEGFLVTGIIAGIGMLLTFVPLMAIMFALLAMLEDSGYMARAAVVTDRLMGTLGLPGRAFLPLVVGFGCNVPAISATRVLPDSRHRLLTSLLVPFTSCSARLTVYVMVAATFFPDNAGTVVFAMYLVSILLVIVGGLLLRSTLLRSMGNEPLVIDLPPYQRPHLPVLAASTWMRVKGFLQTASGIIVTTVTAVWVLGQIPGPGSGATLGAVPVDASLYAWLANQVAVIFTPAGFADWHAAGALIVGFVAKEAVISSWAQTYAAAAPADVGQPGSLGQSVLADFTASSGGHPQAAALAFLVFLLAYTPCVATLAAQRRQIGSRWTAIGLGMQFVLAWLLAVVVFQTAVALT